MTHSLPPLHQTEKTSRHKVDNHRGTNSSRFRELVRKKPKEAIDADRGSHSSHPSLYAMIQQKRAEIPDEDSSVSGIIQACSGLAPSSTNLEATSVNALSIDAPWDAVIEQATQGITHLLAEKMRETSLMLTGPLFAGTPLEGTKIIVREYSTAPLAFNIHFACHPDALAHLQPHLKKLSSFFQNRRYPFSVHSIDADLGDGIPPPIEKDEERGREGRHDQRAQEELKRE